MAISCFILTLYMCMQINKVNLNNNIAINKFGINQEKPQQQSVTQYSDNSSFGNFYYKDCFIDKKMPVSFKGKIQQEVPDTKEKLASSLSALGKYSDDEISEIISMVDTIIEEDNWEETDESLVIEMFDSLARSEKNSSVETMQFFADRICDLEQEDDYVDVNPILKGVSAFCSNFSHDDYRFTNIFIDSYSGILDCPDTEALYDFCDTIKASLNNVDSDKFHKLLMVLNSKINGNDEKLQYAADVMNQLSETHSLKNGELLDGLLMYYSENAKVEDIASKIETRKAVSTVYQNLSAMHIPSYSMFENIYAAPIEELVNRGYSPQEISELLSCADLCHKMSDVESMSKADPEVFADFIEIIPDISDEYELMRKYTKGSDVFNNLLAKYSGDLSKFPDECRFADDTGYAYTKHDAQTDIKSLTAFLDKQSLKRDMVLYRGEGMGVLNQKVLQNGELLGNSIKNAIKNNDTEKLDEITSEIIGGVIVQDGFMSTAYSKSSAKNYIKHEGGILWEINVPKGTHALYADPFNTENGLETEILINRGSSLLIKDTKFEDGVFTICADLI